MLFCSGDLQGPSLHKSVEGWKASHFLSHLQHPMYERPARIVEFGIGTVAICFSRRVNAERLSLAGICLPGAIGGEGTASQSKIDVLAQGSVVT